MNNDFVARPSFVLFTSYGRFLAPLTYEEKGKLATAIFEYVETGEVTTELCPIAQVSLNFIADDLDRSHQKYLQSIENGKKGGRPKTKNNPEQTQENLIEPKPNLNVDVDVDVDETIKTIVCHLNKRADTDYKATTKSTADAIKARLKEEYVLDDFIRVIDKKHKEWSTRPDMAQFLRPQTLFGDKFEAYLNQPEVDGSVGASCARPQPEKPARKRKKSQNYEGRSTWDYDFLTLMEEASVLERVGKHEEAEKLRKKAMEIKKKGT